MDFIRKIIKGKNKIDKFNDENEQAKQKAPLVVMLLNDSIPLLTAVAYVLIGILCNKWHPTWIIFFIIPIYYLTMSCIKHRSAFIFPIAFIVTATYLLLGFLMPGYSGWHPYWALFLIIPLYYSVVTAINDKDIAKFLDVLIPILVVAVFLILGLTGGWWHPGWVVFFAVPIYYQFKDTIKRYRRRKIFDDNDNQNVEIK